MAHDSKVDLEGEFVGEARRARGRLVAVATVLTTLAAAATGYLQASAVRVHDEADVQAERLGALAVSVAATNQDQAQVQVERFRMLAEANAQAQSATSAWLHDHDPSDRLEADRWLTVTKAVARHTSAIANHQQLEINCSASSGDCAGRPLLAICSRAIDGNACGAGSWYSPGSDPAFPTRYQQVAQWESYRLGAQREALNAEADAAENRFSHLAAALTMLAVAVFLFGYSLTPQGREHRGLFIFVATGFAIFGAGWALAHGLSESKKFPSAAATAFANGEVALNEGRYKDASKQLKIATRLWPQSIQAYADLAQAESPVNDPTAVLPLSNLKAIVADDRTAIKNHSESPTVIFDLGANLLTLGLETHSLTDIRQARDLAAQAAARFLEQRSEGLHPGSYLISAVFTIAESDLALDAAGAENEYCSATQTMMELRNEIPPRVVRWYAHADVGLILKAFPQRRRRAHAILSQIDHVVTTGKVPACKIEANAQGSG